jgi:hypothetical protein
VRALVDIVDAAFDAGRRHDRRELEILKTETMAAASKIASDTVEDPPDPEGGYSNIKLAGMLRMLSRAYHMTNPESPRWQIEQQAAGIVEQISDINRELAVGKTMYYASFDEDELPGLRWVVSAMTIADISYCGRFLDKGSKMWIDMAELDADRIFWYRDICEAYCRMRNVIESDEVEL